MTQRTETSPTLLSGVVPPVVDSYRQRLETGPDLRSHLRPGEIVVLTQGEKTVAAPAGQGGTGTTQLAAEYARAAWTSRNSRRDRRGARARPRGDHLRLRPRRGHGRRAPAGG